MKEAVQSIWRGGSGGGGQKMGMSGGKRRLDRKSILDARWMVALSWKLDVM